MKAPITPAQAMQHPTVIETINTLCRMADELRVERDSLLDRLEKAEKDADRYRWLRNGPLVDGEICEELYVAVDSPAWPGNWALVGSDLDKAVDAMEASK